METTTGVVIRLAQEGDAPSIHEVFVSAVKGIDDRYYDGDQRQAWLNVIQAESWPTRMLEMTFIVAEIGPRIVGFAAWSAKKLEHFYVASDVGGQGIGSDLLKYVIAQFEGREIELVASDNAFALYARFGFIEVERYTRPLGQVTVSCIRMIRPTV